MDIVGVTFVATVTGIGGGTLRDLLLGDLPVGWVETPNSIFVCMAAAVLVSAFNSKITGGGRRLRWLLYADAAGLALFAVLGAAKAEAVGAHPLVVVLFGAMSACFGGIIRDVICNETPVVFSQDIYITAALAGGLIYVVLPESSGFEWRAGLGLVSALALRLLAMRYGWSLAFPRYPGKPSG